MWNSGVYKTAREIANELKLTSAPVAEYLRRGTSEGLCKYDGNKAINVTRMRAVVQLDLQGNLVKVWDSGKGASDATSVHKISILACCRGRQKTAGGYRWVYKDDYDLAKA